MNRKEYISKRNPLKFNIGDYYYFYTTICQEKNKNPMSINEFQQKFPRYFNFEGQSVLDTMDLRFNTAFLINSKGNKVLDIL